MKKIATIFIIGAVVLSSIGVFGTQNENFTIESDLYSISNPIVMELTRVNQFYQKSQKLIYYHSELK